MGVLIPFFGQTWLPLAKSRNAEAQARSYTSIFPSVPKIHILHRCNGTKINTNLMVLILWTNSVDLGKLLAVWSEKITSQKRMSTPISSERSVLTELRTGSTQEDTIHFLIICWWGQTPSYWEASMLTTHHGIQVQQIREAAWSRAWRLALS